MMTPYGGGVYARIANGMKIGSGGMINVFHDAELLVCTVSVVVVLAEITLARVNGAVAVTRAVTVRTPWDWGGRSAISQTSRRSCSDHA